jgi:hypothetical protein
MIEAKNGEEEEKNLERGKAMAITQNIAKIDSKAKKLHNLGVQT